MMYYYGLFIFLLGVVLDDIPTHSLIGAGKMPLLETNPVFQYLGYGGMIAVQIFMYIAILWVWYTVVHNYRKYWFNNYKEKKVYDIILFAMCIMLVMVSSLKIEAGINNTMYLMSYVTDDQKKAMIDSKYQELVTMAEERPAEYRQMMKETYKEQFNFGYFHTFFISIMSFLLFKVGVRTTPWGYVD